jgi:hypothetical protein
LFNLVDIEQHLKGLWGEYQKVENSRNYYERDLSYTKPLIFAPTILMVVKPPVEFNPIYGCMEIIEGHPIRFFLYDKETDLIVGCVSEIADNWKNRLIYLSYTAEDRLNRSECPDCGFWLLERTNMHGHAFMGCSGFPECEYSAEIDKVYDDED